MEAAHVELPKFVQNRCYARLGWDREVREFCQHHQMIYQGFSLLTANKELVKHPAVGELAATLGATAAQIIFSFARSLGMMPLTGTSSAEHMQQDLASRDIEIPEEAVAAIESAAG
jgi:diketogulonate reductase-like aldo/keto reductase